jgi:hypothetical protein
VTEPTRSGGPDQTPLPPLDGAQRLLLPVADAFMLLMLSRPSSGSLRTTKVTVVSIVLAASAFVVLAVAGLFVAFGGRGPLLLLAGTLLELIALGCFSLALFGLLQRMHARATE